MATVIFLNRLAEVAYEYLSKGSRIHVTGRLNHSSWLDDTGQKQFATKIIATHLEMLDSQAKHEAIQDETVALEELSQTEMMALSDIDHLI